ncbi:MAG: hypothetical protein JWM35_2185 [Verrucomicrobia bacterium]|nr:hypothetical protein [Verrucomicrobiota bacterium]
MTRARVFLLGLLLVSTIRAEEPAITEKDKAAEPLMMDGISVDAGFSPKQSFGFTMNIRKDNHTQRVHSIYVVQVQRGSEAERKGLGPRVRIYRINGTPVEDFPASFLAGSKLNRLFINRHEGERIVLEISIPGNPAPKTVTLVQHLPSPKGGPILPQF